MPRARNIKPSFFKNEELVELPFEVRLLFVGLWTLADREGRLEDRPKRIKMEIFPADNVDVDQALALLQSAGLVVRYEVDGKRCLWMPAFVKHQNPHHKEVESILPPYPGQSNTTQHASVIDAELRRRVLARDGECLACGAVGDLAIDHIVPLASGGGNEIENLQVLCRKCNSAKGNSTKDYRRADVDSSLHQRCANNTANSLTDPAESLLLIPDSLKETSEVADAPSDAPRYSPEHLAVAEHMANRLVEAGVGKVPKDLGKWADVIRLACERDNRSPDQLREVFDWAHFDDFWRANILSASKLREKFDQLALQRQSKSRGAQGPPGNTRSRAIADDLTDTSWAH